MILFSFDAERLSKRTFSLVCNDEGGVRGVRDRASEKGSERVAYSCIEGGRRKRG